MLKLTKRDNYIQIEVKVQPRSSSNKIAGVEAGRLKVKVNAPPEKGKANQALQELLAKTLKLPKKSVEIVRGETARVKVVRIYGLSVATLQEKLGIKEVEVS